MKQYTLAIYNLFTCINEVFIIQAENEIEAVKQAYIKSQKDEYKQDAIEWMESENIINCETVDDICSEFFNGDIVIGKPIEIK